jgi:hypothetical protein
MNRRSIILGLTTLLAAPAIVRASSLMPIKSFGAPDWRRLAYPVDGFSWYSGFETLNIPATRGAFPIEWTVVSKDMANGVLPVGYIFPVVVKTT